MLDKIGRLLNHNLFSYCEGNPIIACDKDGYSSVTYQLYTMAYLYAILGNESGHNVNFSLRIGGIFPNPIGASITEAISSSNTVKNRVKEYIGRMGNGTTTYTNTEPIEFEYLARGNNYYDYDLSFSIGSASNFTLSVTRMMGPFVEDGPCIYEVEYKISDRYDFAEIKKEGMGKIVEFINNNFGYVPQEMGIMENYNWECSGKFNIIL